MSIPKEKVAELTKKNAFGESKYVLDIVKEGTFKGAICIKALEEKTRPKRYLICEKCGKGYEGYLNKMSDIFRDDNKINNEWFCKKCIIKEPLVRMEKEIERILNNNKKELLSISNEIIINADDILLQYALKRAKELIDDPYYIGMVEQLLNEIDEKFDKKINELFEKLK